MPEGSAPIGTTSGVAAPLSEPDAVQETLTADGLLMYISARMQDLDGRMNDIFERQKRADQARSAIRAVSTQLAKLEERPDSPTILQSSENLDERAVRAAIDEQLEALDTIAPDVAAELRAGLYAKPGGVLHQIAGPPGPAEPSEAERLDKVAESGTPVRVPDGFSMPASVDHPKDAYSGMAVKAAKDLVNTVNKALDSAAQLDMIELQSLTATRQTAISLATNLLTNLTESFKAVGANVGR